MKKDWIIAILSVIGYLVFIFVGFILILSVFSVDSTEEKATEKTVEVSAEKTASTKEENKVKKENKPKLNYITEEITLDDITYKVESVQTNETVANYTSQSGTYLIVKITVRNDSSEALLLNNGDFTIVYDGAVYENDSTTSAYHDGGFLLDTLNPKMSKTASVVYEVPKDIDLTAAALQIQPNMFIDKNVLIQLQKQ